MANFDNVVQPYFEILDYPAVRATLITFLILYAHMAAPRLPQWLAKLLHHGIIKLVFIFLLAYYAYHVLPFMPKRSAGSALVIAIVLVLVLYVLDWMSKGMMSESFKVPQNVETDDNINKWVQPKPNIEREPESQPLGPGVCDPAVYEQYVEPEAVRGYDSSDTLAAI